MELDEAIRIQDALESANQGFDVEEYARVHKPQYREDARQAFRDALWISLQKGGYRRAHHYLTMVIESNR